MKIVTSHEKLVDVLGDLKAIHTAGLGDLLAHEFRLIRTEHVAPDGDQRAYPAQYLAACALAGMVPSEITGDRNAALTAAMELTGACPRRSAMIDAIKRLGNRARTVLAQRNRPQRSGVRS